MATFLNKYPSIFGLVSRLIKATVNVVPFTRNQYNLENNQLLGTRLLSESNQPLETQVFIVGAGAGDIELLTIKALKAIQVADVIMVDWLVNPDIYSLFPKSAERIFVGKKCGQHSMKQADICQLMVEKAKQGKTVVRLKGGDPSIFGRLAEETDELAIHDIAFTIIPGVTAASGCAAYSGIPLTHRDCAQAVKFVTAHLKDADDECNWQQLAKERDTLVFYMGLNRVDKIAERLMTFGMNSSTPIAIIDQGTSADQQVFTSKLATIDAKKDLSTFKGPALIIVGEVVKHRAEVVIEVEIKNLATSSEVNLSNRAA
jgi:uroporphyrin-III C-methyltransferase